MQEGKPCSDPSFSADKGVAIFTHDLGKYACHVAMHLQKVILVESSSLLVEWVRAT